MLGIAKSNICVLLKGIIYMEDCVKYVLFVAAILIKQKLLVNLNSCVTSMFKLRSPISESRNHIVD